jgi:Baseplate J-like protein
MAIFYLDIDDEITSAAARIRGTRDLAVVLVLPAGSRIATSRINFRLLAREAQQRSRRLSIVAPEASTRALAAAAGLPVFASTQEYEASRADASLSDRGPGSDAAAAAEPAQAGGELSAPVGRGASPEPAAGQARRLTSDEVATRDAALAGGVAGGPGGRRERAPSTGPDADRRGARGGLPARSGVTGPGPSTGLGADRDRPAPARPRRRRRALLLVALLLVVVAGVTGGTAAYLYLPTASIVLMIRPAALAPVAFVVTADPTATAADPAAAVVPATIVDIPLTASGTFPSTGKRIDQTAATGSVRWRNCDPTRSYTIPQGTLVRTPDDVAFATSEALFLPVAILNVPKITCQNRTVDVTAATPGPTGNVAAGTITVIPGQYNSVVISVVNPAATTGGVRNEYPKVTQKDVTAALASLGTQLDAQLATAAAAPAGLPAGSTVFPETATRDAAVPSLDPTTLVDQEVADFTLGVTATGTVVTVDQAPIMALGEARLVASVPAGRDLVAGSARVSVGPGSVDGQLVHFSVTAVAQTVPRVDQAALLAQLKGRTAAEARSLLAPYGDANVSLWPDWASTIPTLDARVDLRVVGPSDVAPTPAPSASAGP